MKRRMSWALLAAGVALAGSTAAAGLAAAGSPVLAFTPFPYNYGQVTAGHTASQTPR